MHSVHSFYSFGLFKISSSLQERLGAINDSGEFAQLIETFSEEPTETKRDKAWRAAAQSVLDAHHRDGDERVATFLKEWRGGVWSDLLALASLEDRSADASVAQDSEKGTP